MGEKKKKITGIKQNSWATHWDSAKISNTAITWEPTNKMITSSIYVYLQCNQKKKSCKSYLERAQGIFLILLDVFKGMDGGGRYNCSYNHQDFLIDEP